MSEKKERNEKGQFVNYAGPGRPVRPVERQYLEQLLDKATLERWGKIVDKAVELAETGDAKAREWLAKYLLGERPLTLTQLAMRERMGVTASAEVEALVNDETEQYKIYYEDPLLSNILNESRVEKREPIVTFLMRAAEIAERQNGCRTGEEKSGE